MTFYMLCISIYIPQGKLKSLMDKNSSMLMRNSYNLMCI